MACQDATTGEWVDDSFMDFYLEEKPDHVLHREMQKVVFDTIVAMKILKERFYLTKDEWRMIEVKAYVGLKRKHLLDKLAVDRIIESVEGIIYK